MNLNKDVQITNKSSNSFIAQLKATDENEIVSIEITNDSKLQKIETYGDNFYECLLKIRAELEKRGLFILCLGSSINVWPSGMSSQMSKGLKAYKRKLCQ